MFGAARPVQARARVRRACVREAWSVGFVRGGWARTAFLELLATKELVEHSQVVINLEPPLRGAAHFAAVFFGQQRAKRLKAARSGPARPVGALRVRLTHGGRR